MTPPLLTGLMSRNRALLELRFKNSWQRSYFSPAALGLNRAIAQSIRRHATGKALDAGCGVMPFRALFETLSVEYHSLDIEERVEGVDFVGDLEDVGFLASSSYDTVLCSEVLEHIPNPERAVAELSRLLRPGGKLILSVPFLSRLHEEPHDYARYTIHGLRAMMGRHGLHIIESTVTGSLFSFLGHQVSTIVLVGLHRVPVLRETAFLANLVAIVLPAVFLDATIAPREKLPLGYVIVAQRALP